MPNLTSDMCSSFYGENTNCTTRLRSPLKKDPQIRPKTTLKLCELHYVVTETPKQTTKWGRKNTQRSSAKLEGKCIWFFLGWLRGRQEIRKAIGENEASLMPLAIDMTEKIKTGKLVNCATLETSRRNLRLLRNSGFEEFTASDFGWLLMSAPFLGAWRSCGFDY